MYNDKAEEFLAHYGVLGMKWGVRRPIGKDGRIIQGPTSNQERVIATMKNGDQLVLEKNKDPKLVAFISKYSKSVRNEMVKSHTFSVKDKDGKKIGHLDLYQETPKELNVVWLTVDKNERGKGYATAIMVGAIEIAKAKKMDKVTLEVPGNSPDARHIYEKLGFKVTGSLGDKNDVWNGLTVMELTL